MANDQPATLPRTRRFIPPRRLFVVVAFLFLVVVGVQLPDYLDHSIANIITLIATFFAAMTLLVWFAARSAYPRFLRRGVLLLLLVSLGLGLLLFRIEQTGGELIPHFQRRFDITTTKADDAWLPRVSISRALSRDQAMPAAAAEQVEARDFAVAAAQAESLADDFPQFLGPNRDADLPNVHPKPAWPADGLTQLWKREIGAGWSGFATKGDFAFTLEQRGEDELVTCYDIPTGKLRWAAPIKGRHGTVLGGVGPRSTPTVAGENVVTLGATGVLQCFAAETGRLIWRKDLLELFGVSPEVEAQNIFWGRAASPLVVDGMVVVPAGGPSADKAVSLVAYDLKTGDERWRGGHSQVSYSSPTLATILGKRQILIVNESTLAGHDVTTGEELWSYPWPGSSNSNANTSQPHPVGDHEIFVSKGYTGGSTLLDMVKTDGKLAATEIWANSRAMKTKFTNVVVHNGYVYGLSDGVLECIELATGQRTWKSGRYGHGQILGAGEMLIVLGDEGTLYLLKLNPKAREELASFSALEGITWNTLAISHGRLLVRNGAEAGCFTLPLESASEPSETPAPVGGPTAAIVPPARQR